MVSSCAFSDGELEKWVQSDLVPDIGVGLDLSLKFAMSVND